MTKDYFGPDVAGRYDESSAEMFDAAVLGPAVDLLAALGGEGPALEFAIGTGRIALPLRQRGMEVHGIDLSQSMVDRLRSKAGGAEIPVAVGDITSTRVEGSFALVYLVWNTIMNLTSQDEQVDCFRNAAEHLQPGGRFVVEVMVPQLQRLPPGETVRPVTVTSTRVGFDEYDVVTQGLISHHFWLGDDAGSVSMPFRYVWPSELDLMARLAGMTLEQRWAGWDRAPFTGASTGHVSVWQKD